MADLQRHNRKTDHPINWATKFSSDRHDSSDSELRKYTVRHKRVPAAVSVAMTLPVSATQHKRVRQQRNVTGDSADADLFQ
ncbi:hypothetical protein J6590_032540 [Homalodisca vitripennis]|nr:hypothetical protein J6590_032540 [Homalodisca vitripennis]